MNTNNFDIFFGVNDYNFNSTSVTKHVKLFERKIGKNKPLLVDASFNDIKVEFAKGNADVTLNYEVCLDFYEDLNNR